MKVYTNYQEDDEHFFKYAKSILRKYKNQEKPSFPIHVAIQVIKYIKNTKNLKTTFRMIVPQK